MVSSPPPRLVLFGVFSFDPVSGDLWKNGRRVKLQDQPRQVLAMLVERPGTLVTREELCRALWPDDTFVDFETGLNVVINKLRQALDDSAATPRFIETFPRRGYRFLAPVAAKHEDTGTEPVPIAPGPVVPPRPSIWWMSGIALVALVALGGYAFMANRSRLPANAFDGMKAQRLTGNGKAYRGIALSRDAGWVAYPVVEQKGHQSLWVSQVSIANAGMQIVAPTFGRFGGVNFSPDGSFIYYTFYTFESRASQLYRVPVLGGPPKKLADEVDTVVAFSPDGQRMAFGRALLSEPATSIYVSAVDGSQPRMLARLKDPDGFAIRPSGTARPAWSPDGKVIAMAILSHSTEAIGIVNADTGEVATLGDARWGAIEALEWLPDGRGLLVSGVEGGKNVSGRIWQVDFPGGARRQITGELGNYVGISLSADGSTFATLTGEYFDTLWIASGPSLAQMSEITTNGKHEDGVQGLSWTPDDRLIYSSIASGNLDLWELEVQSGIKRQLTIDTASDAMPAVSPNGRVVAFVSERDGHQRIWVMDRDGTNARALSKGPIDLYPEWGPDGSFLLFEKVQGEGVPFTVSFPGGEEKPFAGFAGTRGLAARMLRPRSISRHGLIGGYTMTPRSIVILSPTGALLQKFDATGRVNRPLRWTPDGLAVTSVNLQDNSNVWSYPRDGGEPRSLTNFTEGSTNSIAWSADGRLALSRGHDRVDVVVFTTAGK